MTYRKIAELAGVSLSTVSKALSGSSEISNETAERIRAIAAEYRIMRPKYNKNRGNLRVAIIVPEIISLFYSQKVTDVMNELEAHSITPTVYVSGFGQEKCVKIMDTIIGEGSADGMISLASAIYPKHTELPIVFTSESGHPMVNASVVSVDMGTAIYEALEYLTRLGHTRIAYAGELYTQSKETYFLNAAGRLKLSVPEEYRFTSNKRFEAIGYEAAAHFLSLDDPPTAVLCAYDEVAMGMIHTYRSSGVSVPDDVSLIGINDIAFASYSEPPLTTIRTFGS